VILLAESGSTKTQWCLADREGIVEQCLTDGINPFFQTRKEISHLIRLQLPPIFFKSKFHTIYFYGAGCSSVEKKNIVKSSLEAQFKTPSIIESDLLGAARSLFQNETGIACILETGSNSCFYDGNVIVKNVKSLGYILGDEGSGASLGRAFLSDCLKGLAPKELTEPFYKKYKIDPDEIMDYVYSKSFPNRLLSVLSFFLYEYLEHPYINNLVHRNLRSFFERNILQYEYTEYPIRFVGFVAKMYSFILREIAQELGIYIDVIIENPINGLIEFHKRNGQLL
jgi:N-acetylglucosamine kinase-like BadF-type ATPase